MFIVIHAPTADVSKLEGAKIVGVRQNKRDANALASTVPVNGGEAVAIAKIVDVLDVEAEVVVKLKRRAVKDEEDGDEGAATVTDPPTPGTATVTDPPTPGTPAVAAKVVAS